MTAPGSAAWPAGYMQGWRDYPSAMWRGFDLPMEEAMTTTIPTTRYEACNRSLVTLEPGVEYTLVRHRDNSDAGRAECYFTDADDAERYVTWLKAKFDAGELGNWDHLQPSSLDLAVYTITRRWVRT